MYAASLLSELGMGRMHKGPLSGQHRCALQLAITLVPSQTQHFESTSSIKQSQHCLSLAVRATRDAFRREKSDSFQLFLLYYRAVI